MERLLVVALAGFAASLVDGALGMGFGPTCSTLLLVAGLAPAAVSFTVNLAKIATGAAGGFAHWKFGNSDRNIILSLMIPGMFGAAAGAAIIGTVDPKVVRPVLAVLLIAIAAKMLLRFSTLGPELHTSNGTPNHTHIRIAGFLGGVTNGLIGAWGPVATPAVLAQRGVEPRVAVGSVNIAEIGVAVAASVSLLGSVGTSNIDVSVLMALLIGGVIAAPAAAWIVKKIPTQPLGIAVAAMLLFTNARDLCTSFDVGTQRWIIYGALALAVGATARRARANQSNEESTHLDHRPAPGHGLVVAGPQDLGS